MKDIQFAGHFYTCYCGNTEVHIPHQVGDTQPNRLAQSSPTLCWGNNEFPVTNKFDIYDRFFDYPYNTKCGEYLLSILEYSPPYMGTETYIHYTIT